MARAAEGTHRGRELGVLGRGVKEGLALLPRRLLRALLLLLLLPVGGACRAAPRLLLRGRLLRLTLPLADGCRLLALLLLLLIIVIVPLLAFLLGAAVQLVCVKLHACLGNFIFAGILLLLLLAGLGLLVAAAPLLLLLLL